MGFLGKALINAVNPRLTLYTRAAFLAIDPHTLINYAVVILLAYFLMGNCQPDRCTARTPPRSQGCKKRKKEQKSGLTPFVLLRVAKTQRERV